MGTPSFSLIRCSRKKCVSLRKHGDLLLELQSDLLVQRWYALIMHTQISLFCSGICFVISPTQASLTWLGKSILWSPRKTPQWPDCPGKPHTILILHPEHWGLRGPAEASCGTTFALHLRCFCVCMCVCLWIVQWRAELVAAVKI